MSLLDWLFGESNKTGASEKNKKLNRLQSGQRTPEKSPTVGTEKHVEGRKKRWHTRREQLYEAVRLGFTQSGVLSATYRFKVLSLDPSEDEFLVMTDVQYSFDHRPDKLLHIESKIVAIAKTHYGISVRSVYWHISAAPVPTSQNPTTPKPARISMSRHHSAVKSSAALTPDKDYDVVEDSEMQAFQKALLAVSNGEVALHQDADQLASELEPFRRMTGFKDTEVQDEEIKPALSTTQYANLN